MRKEHDDLTGKRFGMLTAIARGPDRTWMNKGIPRIIETWDCKCDCGNITNVSYADLTRRCHPTKSCGCLRVSTMKETVKKNIKHGYTNANAEPWKKRLYRIWVELRVRCKDPTSPAYKHYGGRGITYSVEWESFENFKNWALNNGYEDGLTIDRIDVNGNYEPDNCRWATWKQQANNKRNTLIIPIKDERHTASEWEDITGVKNFNIYYRFKNGDHTDDEIISSEDLASRRKRMIVYGNESHSIKDWAKIKGLTYSTINWRLKNGWSIEDALNTPSKERQRRLVSVGDETHSVEEWSQLNNIGITTIYERIRDGWSEQDAVTISPHSGKKHETNEVI